MKDHSNPSPVTAAIIVAAGRGVRAGGGTPKQWRDLGGRPVVSRAVDQLRGIADQVIVVVHPNDMVRAIEMFRGTVTLVAGGDTRTESVRAAIESLDGSTTTRVLIHDAARPLVSEALLRRVLDALDDSPAAAPALPVTDALWIGAEGQVTGSRPRDNLWRAQTPQGFHYEAILAAYRAHAESANDDVEVALAHGIPVRIVRGDESNLKLTYPDDFRRAEKELATEMDVRTGNGFDVHAFTEGDSVVLCGVLVPHSKALLGHSDADVGMHALTDAIYGALAEGDIGRHFPPSDPQWKGAASSIFLAHAAGLARERGFRITHADVTLICERPKVGPHAAAMQVELSRIMGIEPTRISVKATTSEQLGFTGREEGIAAIATATLVKA